MFCCSFTKQSKRRNKEIKTQAEEEERTKTITGRLNNIYDNIKSNTIVLFNSFQEWRKYIFNIFSGMAYETTFITHVFV